MPAYKILLLDHDPQFQRGLRLFLELHGYAAWDAPLCAEAPTLAERYQPDPILLDPEVPAGAGEGLGVPHGPSAHPRTV